MTEGKKTGSKTPRRHYLVFGMIVVILLAFLKSCSDGLKTNDEKIAEYKAELQNLEQEYSGKVVPQEYLNALSKAKIYCEMGKSKEGLFDQLTSIAEKFSEDASQYAIDNIDCDYKANALKMGKFYFEEMEMSKDGVKNQLISIAEKFTEEEAQYAIDNLE